MAFRLPKKLKELTLYTPVRETAPIRLNANESFLELPDEVRAEISEALAGIDLRRYPDPSAEKLLEAAASYFGVEPDCLVPGSGSDELLDLIIGSLLDPGSTMIQALPDFSMYGFYAAKHSIHAVDASAGSLEMNVQRIISMAKDYRARMVIFSNPCNPTSLRISPGEIDRMHRALPRTLLVVDEAYIDFAEGGSITELAPSSDRIIVLRTCSKALGAAAVRLGFAVCSPQLAAVLNSVRSPYNVNAMTQEVGRILFSHPEILREQTRRICRSRDELYLRLNEMAEEKKIRVIRPSTNFVLILTGRDEEVRDELLKRGISVRFLPCGLRITAGSPEENDRVAAALKEIL